MCAVWDNGKLTKAPKVTTKAKTTTVTTKAIDAKDWVYFSKDNKEQQEILALGKEKGGQLEQLYNDFIDYNLEKSKFKTNDLVIIDPSGGVETALKYTKHYIQQSDGSCNVITIK